MNKLTLARGFNRIFIVLAVVWAFYCLLVYPLQMRRKLVESDVEQGATCYDSSDHDFVKDCAKMWRDAADKDSKEWSLVGYYKSQWVLILPAVTILPAIVYGVCRFIAFVFQWIYRGFKQPA
jgi:hypothetical protein